MSEAISILPLLAQAAADAPEVPFFQSATGLFLLLIVAVVAGVVLANVITKALTVSEYSGRMAVVLVSLLVAGLMVTTKWPPKFGVDLRGGINMIGSLNLANLPEGQQVEAKDIIGVLNQRINPSGTKDIMIRPLGTDKIEVTMPTVDLTEAQDIWRKLVKLGKLEFRILALQGQHPVVIERARAQASSESTTERRSPKVKDVNGNDIARWVELARETEPNENTIKPDAPYKFIPPSRSLVRNRATGELININAVPIFGPSEEEQKRQLADWAKEQNIRSLQILVVEPPENQNVEGRHLVSVRSQPDEQGRNAIAFKLNSEGSSRMYMLTSLNKDLPMGIVLDNQLHNAPNINSAIHSRGEITGQFSTREINELINNLNSGKLDVALNNEPISEDFIESTLGNELKQKGFWAIGISLVLVLVFMVFYYRFAGIVATMALLLNMLLILALIMAIDQPLSLTGLAGLVLTVGMSVDANVLIFERIREELDRGAAMRMAIRNGFDKATTTIVDANVTTLITAVVLYAIGTEQIKGFSVTLFLGILMSMFTAIYVSRLVFDIWERKRWLKQINMFRLLEKNKFAFLEKVSLTSIVSALLIAGGIAGMFLLGSKILDQDLRGGSTARMVFKDQQNIDDLRDTLSGLNLVYEHTGEDIEFNVSENGSEDPEFAKRKFKVDSNLPAWEGPESGVEKFKELDEILAETFAGKLLLHSAEIKGLSQTQPPTDGNTDGDAGSDAEPESTDVGLQWRGLPDLNVTALTTSLVTYQEPESEAGGEQQADPESSEEQQPADSAGQETQDPATAEGAAAAEGGANQDETAAADGTPAEGAGDQESEESAEEESAPGNDRVAVTHEMVVKPAVMGKTLVAFLMEAAEQSNLQLYENDITISSPDKIEGETIESTKSENWTVTMQVSEAADADKVLSVWRDRFSTEPVFEASSSVGGQIAGKTMGQAAAAIIASLLGIIAYIWIRFQNLAFGLAAVIALIHDVLIVLGAIAISHWIGDALGFIKMEKFKISLEVIAALLTVIGYSLNDTIVVFDRIREVRGKRTEITKDMINTSISQTLSRTILTSLTTFIVVFILYWAGGDAIHGFAYALVVGVIVGTYSSIFVASPALLWLMNTVGLNPGDPELEPAKGNA